MPEANDFTMVEPDSYETDEYLLGHDFHKMHPGIKKRWIEALRSGEYSQTQRQLADPDGFCCLGVLCEIAVQDGVVVKSPEPTTRTVRYEYTAVDNSSESESTVPPIAVKDWADLSHQNPVFRVPESFLDKYPEAHTGSVDVDSDGNMALSLAGLNDSFHLTFDQIADVIEEYF